MNLIKLLRNKYYRNRPMVKYWKTQDAVEAKVYQHKDGHYEMQMKGEDYPFPGFPRGSLLFGSLSPLKHLIKNLVFNKTWRALEEGNTPDIAHDLAKIACYVREGKPEDEESREMKPLTYDMLPPEKMVPPVKELHRALTAIGVKEWRDIITFILQEDDAYRFRFQWAVKFFPRRPTFKHLDKALEMMEHAEVVGDMKERVRLVRRVLNAIYTTNKAVWDEFFKEVNWKKVKLSKADKYFFRAKYFKVDYPEYDY